MKRNMGLGLILVCIISMLSGCANYEFKTSEVKAEVVKCEKSVFIPNQQYQTLAYAGMAKKDYTKWAMYNSLAQANGVQHYSVIVVIEGTEHTVSRDFSCDIGDMITVTRNDSYLNGELTTTEYQ